MIKSCDELVAVVERINRSQSASEEEVDQYKGEMNGLARQLPPLANGLVETVQKWVTASETTFEYEAEMLNGFRRLRLLVRECKAAVLGLLRQANLTAWSTVTQSSVGNKQLAERSRRVSQAVADLLATMGELAQMEAEEEELWVEAEAEELAESIKAAVVEKAKAVSGAVKDLLEAARVAGGDEARFVTCAKACLFALNGLADLAGSLGLESRAGALKDAVLPFVRSAKAAFAGAAGHEACVEATGPVALAVRQTVLAASQVDTVAIVRKRLFGDEEESEQVKESSSEQAAPDALMSEALRQSQRRKLRPAGAPMTPRGASSGSGLADDGDGTLAERINSSGKMLSHLVTLQRRVRKTQMTGRFRAVALEYLTHPSSERARKRNMALREILSTERIYVEQLEELRDKAIEPMRTSTLPFVSESEVDAIFSNIESILLLNMQILEIMEERMAAWPSNCLFADIFVQKASVFRLYSEYLGNYDNQVKVLAECEARPGFKEWVKARGLKRGFGNYMILPVQRLPRYQILLDNLLKYTEEGHVDLENLQNALAKVLEVNIIVDKRKEEMDNRNALIEVRELLGSKFQFSTHKLRKYIRENDVATVENLARKRWEPCYCFLLNDMIIVCRGSRELKRDQKAKKAAGLQYKETIWFRDGYNVSSPEPSKVALAPLSGKGQFVLTFEKPNHAQTWLSDLQKLHKDALFHRVPKA